MVENNIVLNEDIQLDNNTVERYANNVTLIRKVKKIFKRLTTQSAEKIIRLILRQEIKIHAKSIKTNFKTLVRYNLSKFESDNTLKKNTILELIEIIYTFVNKLEENKIDTKDPNIETRDGEEIYNLDQNSNYIKVRNAIFDSKGEIDFEFDFTDTTLKCQAPVNTDMLQRCEIQITNNPVQFDFPIEYVYYCPVCNNYTRKLAPQTIGFGGKIQCQQFHNFISPTGEPKSKVCNSKISPDMQISIIKDCYYYDITFEDIDKIKKSASAVSFKKIYPGMYECVLFKLNTNNKTELYQVMDFKPFIPKKFVLPKRNENENYLFTLQQAFDKFIEHQTGMKIYGLYPIKVAVLIQTIMSYLEERLIANIQIVGDAATGKSTVLKYYSFLLNNFLNLSTNGVSISVPALRGTKQVINLMGKDHKIVTTGYLGTFKSIHIDEAGQNRELVNDLKAFLYEDNYSYDRAGGTGITNKRTAHVNLSENLNYDFLSYYRGSIKKEYNDKDINDKIAWNDKWDLHQPLFFYNDNALLLTVIKNKRIELQAKQQFWIDGYDFALHQRFPFYFFLVKEHNDPEFDKVIMDNSSRTNIISDNFKLMQVLKTDEISIFLSLLKHKKDKFGGVENFYKINDIIEEYGLHSDTRMRTFYYTILKVSCIINERIDATEQDYDLVRWFIEKTNCKLDVTNTNNYNVVGPPNTEIKDIELTLEPSTSEEFSLPEDEF